MALEILKSELLKGLSHGFFTRRGGASSGVFDGLNCGRGSSDQAEAVTINRARVADAMDVQVSALITVHQVHSPDVATIAQPYSGAPPEADAMVTATPGFALGILTADCIPVLFADRDAGVVGAAHAGWKGALGGILEATLDGMEALGASRRNTCAALGPTISQEHYEVGPEFFDRFVDEAPENVQFFAGGTGDRMLFDLPAYAIARLRAADIGDVAWTRHCTYADPERFFSYRRSTHLKEADYGRLISAIRL